MAFERGRDTSESMVDTARRFAAEVVAPRAAELDAHDDPEACFSWETVEAADRVGLRTATLPPDLGGSGIDSLTVAEIIETLARADLGTAVVFAQTLKIAQTLQAAATPDQKERHLRPYAENPRGLLAIGITEPETASDYIIPYADDDKRFATTARRDGDGWVLSGGKHFISNGNRASLYLVFAQTDPQDSMVRGSTCFLVPREAEGFSVGRVHDKMGERLVNNAELVLDEVRVGDEDILGEVGDGFQMLRVFFPASNAYAAASVLGVAETAYQRALAWCRDRVQGGRPLIEHDTTRADLARMRMLLDATRAYVHRAAAEADLPADQRDPTLGALPKVMAAEAGWEVVTMALELHGGYGYMREVGMEKLVRDAAAFLHSDGTQRALLLKAAKFL